MPGSRSGNGSRSNSSICSSSIASAVVIVLLTMVLVVVVVVALVVHKIELSQQLPPSKAKGMRHQMPGTLGKRLTGISLDVTVETERESITRPIDSKRSRQRTNITTTSGHESV